MNYTPVSIPSSPWANGYLLWDDASSLAMVIDPDMTGEVLLNMIKRRELKLDTIVLTHGHFDHIASVNRLLELFPHAKLMVHRLDAPFLADPELNLSSWQGREIRVRQEVQVLEDGDILSVGEETLRVLHTPGHTPGSICLYTPGVLFSGDTLFKLSVGRCDLPGGDMRKLLSSVREKLFTLPDETKVYPGHGPATTISDERVGNLYLGEME
jgi:glyoxylase-like metal-dependent hydrolase (beta-lactamase superfamily II)